MALYRECSFPNCKKSWWNKQHLYIVGGGAIALPWIRPWLQRRQNLLALTKNCVKFLACTIPLKNLALPFDIWPHHISKHWWWSWFRCLMCGDPAVSFFVVSWIVFSNRRLRSWFSWMYGSITHKTNNVHYEKAPQKTLSSLIILFYNVHI